jgi:hypothetical protein
MEAEVDADRGLFIDARDLRSVLSIAAAGGGVHINMLTRHSFASLCIRIKAKKAPNPASGVSITNTYKRKFRVALALAGCATGEAL